MQNNLAPPSRTDPSRADVPPVRPTRPLRLLLALVALLLTGCTGLVPTPGTGATPSPSPRTTTAPDTVIGAWLQAATEEGAIHAYADLTRQDTDELDRLLARRYPGVRVEWTRGPDRELMTRAVAERGAGGGTWDVFVGEAAPALAGGDHVASWSPPEAGAIRAELLDPRSRWYALTETYHVLEYNSELVPFAARPTSYEMLQDARFYGGLSIQDDSLSWLKGMLASRGPQPAIDLLRPLAQQGMLTRRTPTDLSAFLAAGRNAVAVTNHLDAVERDRRTGGKVGWVAIEPVIVQPSAVVVAADAPRPNGARLVANFLLSADAQHALAANGRVPARVDVDPDPQGLVRGLRTHLALPPVGQEEQELRALHASLWFGR